MIVRKHTTILFLILCTSFIGMPVCADNLYFSRTYSLPITEMQDIVTKWLKDSDFEILRVDQELSQVRLSAESREKIWEICLSQQSPLATLVTICKGRRGPKNKDLQNRLWNYISEYVNSPEIKVSDTQRKIPNIILAQTESVVCIEAKAAGRTYQASGFVVDDNGRIRIISTAHDFKNLKAINIIFYDGSEVAGRILKIDFHRDLSLIQIDKKPEHFIPLSISRNLLEIGEKLYSVSCPINLGKAVFSGSFTAPKRVDDLILWQVQMNIYPGSSGSPVFDEFGNLSAIVTGRYRGTDSVGFLIPVETLMEFLKEI
jgi:serine protease Do